MVIRPLLHLPTYGHDHVIYIGNLGGGEFLSHENTPEGTQRPTKVHFFPYKQESQRNGDHE